MFADYFEFVTRRSPGFSEIISAGKSFVLSPREFLFVCFDRLEQTVGEVVFTADVDFSEHFVDHRYSKQINVHQTTRQLKSGKKNEKQTSQAVSVWQQKRVGARRKRVQPARPLHLLDQASRTLARALSYVEQCLSSEKKRFRVALDESLTAALERLCATIEHTTGIRVSIPVFLRSLLSSDVGQQQIDWQHSHGMGFTFARIDGNLNQLDEPTIEDDTDDDDSNDEENTDEDSSNGKMFFIESPSLSPLPSRWSSAHDIRTIDGDIELSPLPHALFGSTSSQMIIPDIDLGF